MGREPTERQIGEHVYRVRPMMPKRILRTAPILGKLVVPALGHLIDNAKGGKISDVLGADVSGLSFGAAAQALVAAWEQPKIDELIEELAASTEVGLDGCSRWPLLSTCFDAHFSGRTKEMLGWIAFAVEVQYGDFFAGLLAGAGRAQATMGQASQSQSISAGLSGA
jgi:hypothetical protein